MMIEGFGSGSIPLTSESGSGRPKKHVDPVDPDPDPQHCKKIFLAYIEHFLFRVVLRLRGIIVATPIMVQFFPQNLIIYA
jgi:hypothetical protein